MATNIDDLSRNGRNGRAARSKRALEPTQAKKPDFQEIGVSGTRLFAGIVSEETVPALQGFQAYKTFHGMRMDATGSALLQSIILPIRSARWFVNPASEDEDDLTMADFVHDVIWEFGSQSMDDVIRLALGMLAFGFSTLEICWSVIEQGPWQGKIGWDKLAWRSQATKWRWNMDYINGKRQLVSMTQLAPPYYQAVDLPRNKLLVWVNDLEGDNFDGISALRAGWKDYYIRDQLYRIRAIGLERGFMGLPVATVPDEFSDEYAGIARQIVETVRTDEQAGVVHPAGMDFRIEKWELNGPAMNHAIDYHNRQILLAQLAQFLELGAKTVGSYALSTDHSDLFQMAINAKANYFAEIMNLNPGIPQLIEFNFPSVEKSRMPRLQHGDIGQRSLDKLGRTLQALGQWGFLTPDNATEDRLRQMLDLPEREEAITERALLDLIMEVSPPGTEYGRQHLEQRLESPLEVTAKTAAARSALSKAKAAALEAPAPSAASAPSGPGTPEQRNSSTTMAEDIRYAENRARLAELVVRRPWTRPKGRLTERERMAIRATEAITESLEEFSNSGRQRPVRPSLWAAMHRRPYEIQAREPREGVLLEPGQPRTVLTRQMALVKSHREQLRSILRARAGAPPTPSVPEA